VSLSLAELQKRVQAAILAPDRPFVDLIKPPPRDSAKTMFGVYKSAYRLRLAEFLANDHEKLRAFLGDAQFAALARDYIAANPSDQSNARWYARKLPEFLATNDPYRGSPILRDLAVLERALNDAFDAADRPIVTLADLAGLSGEQFGAARLRFHPSFSLQSVTHDLESLWRELETHDDGERNPREESCAGRINSAAAGEAAVHSESADMPGPAPEPRLSLSAPVTIAVWRQSSSSRFRRLEAEEEMALISARDGMPFGAICEMIAVMGDAEGAALRAAGYLRAWIDCEIVTSVEVTETPATS